MITYNTSTVRVFEFESTSENVISYTLTQDNTKSHLELYLSAYLDNESISIIDANKHSVKLNHDKQAISIVVELDVKINNVLTTLSYDITNRISNKSSNSIDFYVIYSAFLNYSLSILQANGDTIVFDTTDNMRILINTYKLKSHKSSNLIFNINDKLSQLVYNEPV